LKTRTVPVVAISVVAILVAACSSGASPSPSSTPAPTGTPGASSTPAASSAPLGVDSFDSAFTAMSQLTSVTAAGSGMIGVILPDTTSSARYVDFDAPYLKQALTAAGYSTSDFKIDNAQGSDATELNLAQADITLGAKVLIMDPIDSTVGNQIQSLAASKGVTLISYDRATFQGTNTYYVSFDNVQVGKLIGQGFMQCVTDWKVSSPKVFELDGGEDTDPNAISFAQGYNQAIWGTNTTPLTGTVTNSAGYSLVGDQIAPGWNNTQGGTIFQQQYTAHPEINATVEANDGLANAVITVLKAKGVPPKTIPTTGQDATLQGMENILQGYQCGSVYKPIYLEAQAAVALATYLRAGQTPPAALVNGTTTDPANSSITEPAVLLTPTWVTASNMADTVIKDKFVSASDLCTAVGASVCQANNIPTS
jgi:D-xylose transport system substrate-binding protein